MIAPRLISGVVAALGLACVCAAPPPAAAAFLGERLAGDLLFEVLEPGFPDQEGEAVVGASVEFTRALAEGGVLFSIDVDGLDDTVTFTYVNELDGDGDPCQPGETPDCSFDAGLLAAGLSGFAETVRGLRLLSSSFPEDAFVTLSTAEDSLRVDFRDGLLLPGFGTTWSATFKVLTGPLISYSPSAALDDPDASNPIEGDFVFMSCVDAVGAAPEARTCRWTARVLGDESPSLEAQGPIVVFAFPRDGTVRVERVIEGVGGSSSFTLEDITIANGPPLINALDVEVLEGGEAEAICRFADPGVFDEHEVTFTFGAGITAIGNTEIQEENEPSLSSGFGSQRFSVDAAPGPLLATCSVFDGTDTVAMDFTVTVVSAEELAGREDADTDAAGGAPGVNAGQEIIGRLDTPDDIDVFQILPDEASGEPRLKVGGELVLQLKVPADYDLILLSTSTSGTAAPSPFVNAPFVNAPFVNAPFVNVPFVNVPFVNAPFVNAPFVNAPFVNAPFVNAPFVNAPFVNAPLPGSPFLAAGFEFTDFPLSQVGLAAPDGSFVSGSDIGLDELGSASLGALLTENLEVQMFSAQPGKQTEKVLVRVSPGVERLYAAIVSNSGAFAAAPYSLRVEGSSPPSQEQLIGEQCLRDELVEPARRTLTTEILHAPAPGVDARTLIVTQRERFSATFGLTATEYADEFIGASEMQSYLNHDLVEALVISVPSAWFDDADRNGCSIAAQNSVSELIREEIITTWLAANPEVENIILMGGADIIPPYYTPDETTVGYEGLYGTDLLMEPGRPIAVAFAEGNNITDAFYGDLDPRPFRGRSLFLEDRGVARFVETPGEILAAVGAFGDGTIALDRALTTGYDFFQDGAAETAAIFATIVPAGSLDTLISDVWGGDELRCAYLADTGVSLACPVEPPALTALNFHASYNAGISAFGFQDFPENVSPVEIIEANESTLGLTGGLTLSIGCHAGLNVPDAWALPDNVGLPLDPAQDWVQQPGNWIGAWNFALGDSTVANRGTEGLITLVAEELAGGATLGEALLRAKQRYAVGLFEFDVHDEKSLIGLALFGTPQSRLAVPDNPPPPSLPLPGVPDPAGDSLQLMVTGSSSGPISEITPYRRVDTAGAGNNGEYFALGRNAQAVVGRPLLPIAKPIDAARVLRSERLHDAIITGATFVDVPGIDPVFAFPQHDWVTSQEPQACVETFAPSQLSIATSLDIPSRDGSPQEALESLIVIGAQFRCTNRGSPIVRGTLRKFTGLDVEVQRPSTGPADDFVPPVVSRQNLIANPLNDDVTANIEVTDNFGMREAVVLVYDSPTAGAIRSVRVDLTDGASSFTIPGGKGKPLAFQYVDNSGNVLLKSGKGALLAPVDVKVVTTDIVAGPGVELEVSLAGAAALGDPELTVDFGTGFRTVELFDAAGDANPGVFVDAVTGDARIFLTLDFSGYGEPSVDVAVTARAGGAEGFDRTTLGVTIRQCDIDISGIVDITDVRLISGARGQPAAFSPRMDVDGDGTITVRDARQCIGLCTNLRCAP